MSQPRRPLFDSYASAKGSPAQQKPNLHAEATTAAPKPERQDDSNAAGESNNATQHKPQMAQIEEAMKSQSEGLRQTSSRLPSTHTEVPTVTFQTIIFECSSTLSPRDLQAIAQFQGQLGSPNTLGGDPPYPVAENMEISRRNVLYEDGCFDREGTENAFRENKLARIRDNQRRSRARRREYVQDLKRRLREYETQGIEASTEVQMAARRVAEENKQLQELLNRHGISDDQITRFLQSGTLPLDSNQGQPFHAEDPSAAVQSLQRLLMPRQLASLDEDFSYIWVDDKFVRLGAVAARDVLVRLSTSHGHGYCSHGIGCSFSVSTDNPIESREHHATRLRLWRATVPVDARQSRPSHGNNTAYVYWRPYGNALALFCADLSKRSGTAL
ncbi:uncharacterized protein HRG_08530 [Hirsutella rhossiliensis]|uniref:BZIP domain-containing protein n=1 Tax=Hirsutella rhossiliensis TaxID=111463 RepID=A0A9P8MSF6_9HYPO|nr:uncharacterized protein HRG_08530 [Hirsutella rhossiliensis]KAH0960375.1 hypothetical protein HRG_08530 [Hirsutella rhossiliensis]